MSHDWASTRPGPGKEGTHLELVASGWVRVNVRAAGVRLSDLHLIDGEQTGFRLASGEAASGAWESRLVPGRSVVLCLLRNRPDGVSDDGQGQEIVSVAMGDSHASKAERGGVEQRSGRLLLAIPPGWASVT